MKKYLLGLLMVAFVIVPFVGQAISVQEIMAQIAALQAQLAAMQNQQPIETSSTTPVAVSCPTITRNLQLGSTGADVSALQQYLIDEGFLGLPKPTGYFGPMTRSAVINWQKAHDISPANGIFDAISRAALAELCGNVTPGNISITGVSGPNSLAINETGRWTINVTAPSGTNLNYSVDWGDQVTYPATANAGSKTEVSQTATFTHAYSQAGTYTVKFIVSNSIVCIQAPCNARQSAETSLTVVVGESAQPFITVLSPNGGERLVRGQNYNIRWVGVSGTGAIYLKSDTQEAIDGHQGTGIVSIISNSTSLSTGSFNWTVPATLGVGNDYHIYIVNPLSRAWGQGSNFTITSGTNTQPSITVLSPNGGETWQLGSTHNITWQTSNFGASVVYIALYREGKSTPIIPPWTANNNGSYTWDIPAGASINSVFACSNAGCTNRFKIFTSAVKPNAGGIVEDSSNNYFTITGGPVPPCSAGVPGCANPYHPADLNKDYKISQDEMNAYATLWRDGQGGVTISQVTRAGLFFDAGGYKLQAGTVDGFAPIPKTGAVSQSSTNLLASVFSATQSLPTINPIASSVDVNGIVTLTGKGFTSLNNTVRIGKTFSVIIHSPTTNSIKVHLQKRVPAGIHAVYITNAKGQQSNKVYLTITSATPIINPIASSVDVNGTVTLTGTGFNSLHNAVHIGASFNVDIASPTTNSLKIHLQKRVPAGTHLVYITNAKGQSNKVSLSITSSENPSCQSLYWHDSVNTACGRKQFCGEYLYQSLETFSTLAACQADLNSPLYHSADLNKNYKIEKGDIAGEVNELQAFITLYQAPESNITLSELLRVIQFSNSAGYHIDLTNKEDGFAPGPK